MGLRVDLLCVQLDGGAGEDLLLRGGLGAAAHGAVEAVLDAQRRGARREREVVVGEAQPLGRVQGGGAK